MGLSSEGREARGPPAPFPSCTRWRLLAGWIRTVAFRDARCSPGHGAKQPCPHTSQQHTLSERMTYVQPMASHPSSQTLLREVTGTPSQGA